MLTILTSALFLGFLSSFHVYGANETSTKFDDSDLEKLVGEYANWTANVPDKDKPGKDKAGIECVINKGPVIFLLDPFDKGNKVTQKCSIKSGTPLLFPFLLGWQDTGTLPGKTLDEFLADVPGENMFKITMKAILDNSTIVDKTVDNLNPYKFGLSQDQFYKEIFTHSLFNFTVTEDMNLACKKLPRPSSDACQGIAQCFCGFINGLSSGNHTLRYATVLGITDNPEEYNDAVTYKFNVN